MQEYGAKSLLGTCECSCQKWAMLVVSFGSAVLYLKTFEEFESTGARSSCFRFRRCRFLRPWELSYLLNGWNLVENALRFTDSSVCNGDGAKVLIHHSGSVQWSLQPSPTREMRFQDFE